MLTPAEVEALLRSADSDQDAAIYTVAAFTGLRLAELRALRWSDMDFGKRLVHVRGNYTSRTLGDPKSGKVRSVPLIDQALAAFDRLSRREHFTGADDLLFCSVVATSTTRPYGGGSTRRSTEPGSSACASTTFGTRSGRWRCRRSRCRT